MLKEVVSSLLLAVLCEVLLLQGCFPVSFPSLLRLSISLVIFVLLSVQGLTAFQSWAWG